MGVIGMGGGCHWCTEAVFLALKGVVKVEQGWVGSVEPDDSFSEAVVVHFDESMIGVRDLVEVHLRTHRSGSDHSMRGKYRSAVYVVSDAQGCEVESILDDWDGDLVTRVLPLVVFNESEERFRRYYEKHVGKGFSERFIEPKMELLRGEFGKLLG